ncbi:MAG: hypothetical protein IKG47_10590 [Oscillospiraceae bacterium]|nr:hypothetical protein [Oscillospiraceae bacterium]
MIYYTEEGYPSFNHARKTACFSLDRTLDELNGIEGISELIFRDQWAKNMSESNDVFADGWYSPPPMGIAVLSDDRVNFDSLRNPEYWAGDTEINWKGILYAYASPVDRVSGYIGDISVTLYFGNDNRIIEHIKKCHEATMTVFNRMNECGTAGDLFRMSQRVFEEYRLKSTVISRTDNMPINLGHTFPFLSGISDKIKLSAEDKLTISTSRLFLNATADWGFDDNLQFTVEPQLVSLDDPSMPKITQHYVVKYIEGDFIVCNDIDGILNRYSLV